MKPHLFITIPALDECDYLPRTLQAVFSQVTGHPFSVYVCVNQPDDWWENEEKKEVCFRNRQLLQWLATSDYKKDLNVIDRSSKGLGWKGKHHGVGWARKTLFDEVLSVASEEDILISLDADTLFNNRYFQSIGDNFAAHPDLPVISVPYYHALTGNDTVDKSMLRYEIYLRNWLLNLFRINSPYAFTAVGSAMAMKVKVLKKIGGITPVKSGEDFYLMQKLRKMVPVNNWNEEWVYPAGRFSNRVFFGTGPAMIKGAGGDWTSYPIYHHSLFDKIAETYQQIDQLFTGDIETPFLSFLKMQFKEEYPWQPLRDNFKELPLFKKAFHEKADGLRLFQFIRQEHDKAGLPDEKGLVDNLNLFLEGEESLFLQEYFAIDSYSVQELNRIRDLLFQVEMKKRSLSLHGC